METRQRRRRRRVSNLNESSNDPRRQTLLTERILEFLNPQNCRFILGIRFTILQLILNSHRKGAVCPLLDETLTHYANRAITFS